MLRRKLILRLTPLVVMLLATAIVAVWVLERFLLEFDDASAAHVVTEQFRWLVLGLTGAFVLVINVSIVLLLHTAGMILRPVDQLVQATHRLAEGRLDYRVSLGRGDEFDTLAEAYNALAKRLAADEQRRVEVLGQVALTMNHELNNAISIIELQLRLLARQSGGGAGVENCLRQIHQGLGRMTESVQRLRNARRIVLVDYVPGIKMLDLHRSAGPLCEPEKRMVRAC